MIPEIIIVFFGVRGSGKSTLGAYLESQYSFYNTAFANPLKKVAKLIFGFEDEHLYGPSDQRTTQYHDFVNTGWCFACHVQCEKTSIRTIHTAHPWQCPRCHERYPRFIDPRHALKTLGTEWGRAICRDLWAQSLFLDIQDHFATCDALTPMPHRAVVTDGRFKNENALCAEKGALRILLTRGLAESTDPHPSEAEVREQAVDHYNFDVVINNAELSVLDSILALECILSERYRGRGIGFPDSPPIADIIDASMKK